MTKLIYVTNMSLDGYIEDEHGSIDFFPVDAEVFRSHTQTCCSPRARSSTGGACTK